MISDNESVYVLVTLKVSIVLGSFTDNDELSSQTQCPIDLVF